MQATDWAANASFSSTAPTSDQLTPARLSAMVAVKNCGSFAVAPRPAI